MWRQPPGYIAALREITRDHGILLICDEVATGFGRTGMMFAVEHEQVEPDLLCLGKGLTGGYLPLAATLATEEIYRAFLAPYESFQAFFHGHTYTGNQLASAVAIANLNIFEKEGVVARVKERANSLSKQLSRKFQTLPHVGDVRQCGLMVGIELVKDKEKRSPYEAAQRVGQKVCREVRRNGIFLRPLGDVMILMPPLSITEDEISLLCDVASKAIRTITE